MGTGAPTYTCMWSKASSPLTASTSSNWGGGEKSGCGKEKTGSPHVRKAASWSTALGGWEGTELRPCLPVLPERWDRVGQEAPFYTLFLLPPLRIWGMLLRKGGLDSNPCLPSPPAPRRGRLQAPLAPPQFTDSFFLPPQAATAPRAPLSLALAQHNGLAASRFHDTLPACLPDWGSLQQGLHFKLPTSVHSPA